MSRRSLPANDARTDRKNAKRTARRPAHQDKYAGRRGSPQDRNLNEQLGALARHFNGERADRG
ncbi:hypothetical protein [Nocardioides aurantiacus]|uniref:Uncharacterized protein n=1 Tax=Nocardioides aurantiacus TaxID=86796 RepID=A0A3N2CP94_9ACTN|nr:hypothetical protein [Nocardioides aurantiacus]ROR89332.1 hypothetical protein EDD33_0152 [Nocardioides aurantiacus]